MPEHFTKNTVSATWWCPKCGKATEHRVDGGRRGPCLVCLSLPSQEKAPPVPKTMSLF